MMIIYGLNPGGGRGEFFRTRPDWPWGPIQLPIQWIPCHSRGVKQPGRGVDHPLPLAPRLKKEYSYTSTFLLCVQMKHKEIHGRQSLHSHPTQKTPSACDSAVWRKYVGYISTERCFYRTVFLQNGVSTEQCFYRTVFLQNGVSTEWCFYRMVFLQNGVSPSNNTRSHVTCLIFLSNLTLKTLN